MTKRELIESLIAFKDDVEIMILDGFNAGGYPRTINVGPRLHTITDEDAEECGDCERKVGQPVIVIGYGSY